MLIWSSFLALRKLSYSLPSSCVLISTIRSSNTLKNACLTLTDSSRSWQLLSTEWSERLRSLLNVLGKPSGSGVLVWKTPFEMSKAIMYVSKLYSQTWYPTFVHRPLDIPKIREPGFSMKNTISSERAYVIPKSACVSRGSNSLNKLSMIRASWVW